MGGKVKSEEYARFIVCREFGWDYSTFFNQPPFFIEEIMVFLTQENLKSRDDAKEIESISEQKGPKEGGIQR